MRVVLALLMTTSIAFAQTPVKRQGGACPDNYTGSGSYCVPKNERAKQAIPRERGKACPHGYHGSGDACLSYR